VFRELMCSRGACIDSTETHQEVKARDGVGLPMPSMPAISMANGGMGTGMMAMCDDACEGIGIGMTTRSSMVNSRSAHSLKPQPKR
jgi:hypothetical protein